ncbi:hypothetical protein RHMOL_Rhmol11G0270400 [Rhododendron molle]|uniref:Uncharacterized protein n=1 Tax=Rhododendron molle TaxID=49168 RepID=A0ACC0LY58_RHOML|nr:hypothetical protein RHMOL_Rhmol11G0270400 [Rhododendron molle]
MGPSFIMIMSFYVVYKDQDLEDHMNHSTAPDPWVRLIVQAQVLAAICGPSQRESRRNWLRLSNSCVPKKVLLKEERLVIMAEIVVEPFVSFVVERLGNLLIQEYRLLHGVRAQVEQMQKELSRMQCFLKAADARRGEGDELVSNCISEIRELSFDAEDVIATSVIKVALMRRGKIFSESRTRHEVGLEIEHINKKITDLTRSLQTYGIQPTIALGESSTSRTERVQQLRRSYPHVVEEDIICLDEDVKAVVVHLVNEMTNRRVISIWGMGGLGKTTLAKMVYNHIDVRHHFDCFAWAYISQQFKTREVLEEILIQLTSPELEGREKIRRMRHGELVGELYQAQSRMKCLVILDDVWDVKAWNRLSPACPRKKAGSKILLTTRIREVASFADKQCLHELRHLTEPESWELFQKKACLKSEVTEFRLSTEMTVLGEKMVKHCGGLPLAIVVLGGLLATKRTLGEWEMACFLCLSDLPEDEDIRPIKLIQRWMAEGFVSLPVCARVEEVEDVTMLDIGMSYLDELRYRCIIQVGQLTRNSGRVKFYRLHDLVRDLCLLKAQEENFVKVVRMGEDLATTSSSSSSSITIRRLGVSCKANRNVGDNRRRGHVKALRKDKTCILHHVRSCQFYSFGNTLEDSDWRHEDPMPTLEKLPNLRCLMLCRGEYKEMVCSAGGFPQLISLELWDIDDVEEWRVERGAMPSLLDLTIRGCKKLKEIPDGLRFSLIPMTTIAEAKKFRVFYQKGIFKS